MCYNTDCYDVIRSVAGGYNRYFISATSSHLKKITISQSGYFYTFFAKYYTYHKK